MGVYRIILFCGLLSLLAPSATFAQRTQDLVVPDYEFRQGLDLFGKQKYAEAQDVFDGIVASAKNQNDLLVTDAEYYAAICAMELFHKDAEVRLKAFLSHHPESPRCRLVNFQLGRYNYRKKDYDEAIQWFRQVEIYDLSNEELSEFYFKRGYAHYQLGHIDSAKKDFFEIREINSKYSPSANYFYSHIAYTEGNYETAINGFLRLQEDPVFGPLMPWYIAQIYYLQGKYELVISFAPPLLDSSDTKKVPEIAHIIGASYYRLNRYREAIPFLLKHSDKVGSLTRQESYELGFSYYKSDSVAQAIPFLTDAAADSSDALAQNAWYHLADAHMRNGDKQNARTAFGKASSMKFDPIIREDALFSYAELSYELSFSPFNEAIVALNAYLAEYPNNPRSDEAYLLLTNVYLSSKNYGLALSSIEKIKILNPAMQATYQKVAFNRGIELFNQQDYTGAIGHFDKSLTYPISRELNSNAHYWKGESWYAQAEAKRTDSTGYNKAIDCYKKFQVTPGAPILANYNTANYNIGYCYMEQHKYEEAVVWFRKYVTNKTANDPNERVFDAYLCMGDGYFRMAEFINAAEFYGKAVATPTANGYNKDYALYQQAMAYGYLGKKQEKADALKKMRTDYPASNYVKNGRYQEARTLHELKDYDRALALYNEVYMLDKTGVFAVSCLTNMGSIYRVQNDNDNALAMYKDAAQLLRGKGTSDFTDVMKEIKEIYLTKNQLDQWETYSVSMGYTESQVVADSTAYAQAAKMFNSGNCTEALAQANKYILRYPSGIYVTEIYYMRAECSYKNGDTTNALASYNYILTKGQTKYSDISMKRAGYIYYTRKDWNNASRIYSRLAREAKNEGDRNDASVNAMRTYLFGKNIDSANVYASQVVGLNGVANAVKGEANYVKGKAALSAGDMVNAETYFSKVGGLAPNTVYAAEASYQICRIKYMAKPSKGVQTAILKHINEYDAFPEWSGEGWLLLADNYLALKDTSGAKIILEGYIENGDSPSHVQRAKDKLMVIENAQSNPAERRQEDIILPGGDPKDQKLFESGQGNGEGGQQ
jgi:tetratricopeptide (TPR) repeat protein